MIQDLIQRVGEKKYSFFGVFFLIFLFSYLILVAVDFVPEPKQKQEIKQEIEESPAQIEQMAHDDFSYPMDTTHTPLMPESIYIKKLNRTVSVLNPSSRTVADLDTALLSGVVRHPDSADLAQDGNVFILGHSSYLPNVLNKNFQAFNGIQDLAWGDTIEVTSDGYLHLYEVEKVYKASASDTTVPISGTGPRLTLATCNSFGSTDDRFIVEAKRVDVRPL
ncbi:MAG: sortase [Candidatus Pacebacteria bacterium]|nr:sortase [Candidatus Paceibacterota bacterium]